MRRSNPRNKAPYSPHKQLSACITTSGGEGNLHPDGDRTFSLQELACLQGFPLYHVFVGSVEGIRRGVTAIKRMIGNAVPPIVAAQLLREVKKSLEESDARMAAWKAEVVEVD